MKAYGTIIGRKVSLREDIILNGGQWSLICIHYFFKHESMNLRNKTLKPVLSQNIVIFYLLPYLSKFFPNFLIFILMTRKNFHSFIPLLPLVCF